MPPHDARHPRSLRKDALAVSPVVAVILMVAVTIVLSATVFIIVNNLTSQVGEPTLVMAVDQDVNSDAEWKVTVLSASQRLSLDSFQFLMTVPNGTVVRINPGPNFGTLEGDFPSSGLPVNVGMSSTSTPGENSVRAIFTDVDGNNQWSATDILRLRYDDTDVDPNFDDDWPGGAYKLEIRHIQSSALLVTLERQV